MTARQRASRRRRIGRAASRAARRAAQRPADQPDAVFLSPMGFARRLVELGVQTHVGFDADGNVEQIPIDPDVFAAEVARMDAHPHDSDEPDDVLYDVPGAGDLDDDCPICRALRVAAVGPPDRRWSMD